MKHEIHHDLDVATAKKVTDRAFSEYKSKFPDYSPTFQWTSDNQADVSFSVKGKRLDGSIAIAEKTITLHLDVPLLMRPFQGMAVGVIDKEVKNWIEKARKGEL